MSRPKGSLARSKKIGINALLAARNPGSHTYGSIQEIFGWHGHVLD